jgi:hypothetical protein
MWSRLARLTRRPATWPLLLALLAIALHGTSTGSPKPTRTSSGPSTPMVTSLATSATLPG